jgi:hypothetical protein
LKSRITAAEPGSALTVVGEGEGDDEPPLNATATPIATAMPAIPAAAASSTFGEAFLPPPVLRTGGRACACCRWRRACFPLVIAP